MPGRDAGYATPCSVPARAFVIIGREDGERVAARCRTKFDTDSTAAAERSVRFSFRLFTCSMMRCSSSFPAMPQATMSMSSLRSISSRSIAKIHPSLDREVDLIHESTNDRRGVTTRISDEDVCHRCLLRASPVRVSRSIGPRCDVDFLAVAGAVRSAVGEEHRMKRRPT